MLLFDDDILIVPFLPPTSQLYKNYYKPRKNFHNDHLTSPPLYRLHQKGIVSQKNIIMENR